ncbi:hypothetical protein BV25DRAFT_1919768 [Artomyces pyxidatus]|uniref:Uncharacterized protein n=1 Tax=Artomyces pyxidatus TaxID=48021 RepID=A0ACB8SPM5_9AGAM|nr:hypothetical protein BV25DRAFT_1919768 [Artomyces pyxidatus]
MDTPAEETDLESVVSERSPSTANTKLPRHPACERCAERGLSCIPDANTSNTCTNCRKAHVTCSFTPASSSTRQDKREPPKSKLSLKFEAIVDPTTITDSPEPLSPIKNNNATTRSRDIPLLPSAALGKEHEETAEGGRGEDDRRSNTTVTKGKSRRRTSMARIRERIRRIEEKAKDVVNELSALKEYAG